MLNFRSFFILFLLMFCITAFSVKAEEINTSNKNIISNDLQIDYALLQEKPDSTLVANTKISPLKYNIATQKPLVSDEWQFFIAPYLWFVGLNGNVSINGNQSNVDASFGDIWDQLDFAFQIHAEAMKNNYFFFIDETYMKLSVNQDIVPDTPLPIGANINIGIQMNALEFGGGYRLVAAKSDFPVYFDLYTGGRWWIVDLDQKIKFNNLPDQNSDQNQQWVDVIVGARIIAQLGDNLLATVKSDIGGFDFGFSSKFSWNIIANIGWETGWHGLTPYIGWRSMYVDYEDGSGSDFFQYNVWMNGIQTGLGFRF